MIKVEFLSQTGFSNKILLFDSKGEYVTTIHNGELLKEPRGISLDAHGNLVVCDAGNKCVKFFLTEGELFKTIAGGVDYECHLMACVMIIKSLYQISIPISSKFTRAMGDSYMNLVDIALGMETQITLLD